MIYVSVLWSAWSGHRVSNPCSTRRRVISTRILRWALFRGGNEGLAEGPCSRAAGRGGRQHQEPQNHQPDTKPWSGSAPRELRDHPFTGAGTLVMFGRGVLPWDASWPLNSPSWKFYVLVVWSVIIVSSGEGRLWTFVVFNFPFFLCPSPFIYAFFFCPFVGVCPVGFPRRGGQGSGVTGDRLLRAPRRAQGQCSPWPVVTFFDYVPYARDSVLNASISPCLAECNRAL